MSDLVWAIKNGDIEHVKDFVDRESIDLNNEIDGRQPIIYAADYGHKDIIEYFIDKGADIEAKDKHGITSMLAAIWEGHLDCVKLLLEKGASKCGTTPDGSPYETAALNSDIKKLLKS